MDEQFDIRKAPFLYLQEHPNDYFRKVSKQINHSDKPYDDKVFRNTFLCASNMSYVNNQIKKKVYAQTINKYIIPDQKYEHMYLVMNNIYDSYATHMSTYKKEELDMLNNVTIDFCTETIIDEITHKYKYLKRLYSPPTTMPDPENCSVRGTKSYATQMSYKFTPYDVTKKIKDKDVYSRSIMVSDHNIEDFCGHNPLWM